MAISVYQLIGFWAVVWSQCMSVHSQGAWERKTCRLSTCCSAVAMRRLRRYLEEVFVQSVWQG